MGLDDKVFSETNQEEGGSRNANLEGEKSTETHRQEAHMDNKMAAKREENPTSMEPEEVKSHSDILPGDAQKKASNSCSQEQKH